MVKKLGVFILNIPWKVVLMDQVLYNKTFKDSVAECDARNRIIYISEEGNDVESIAHELTHAYTEECCANLHSLNSAQIEEFYCELVAKHSREIWRVARKIYKVLNT